MAQAGYVIASLILVGLALWLGGIPWGILCGMALVPLLRTDRKASHLVLVGCSFAWLAASRLTDRRDFFFPYTMSLASLIFLQLAERNFWQGVVGVVAALTAFFVVRIGQHASTRVLLVEFVAATAILEIVMVAHGRSRGSLPWQVVILLLSSGLAYLSLAL